MIASQITNTMCTEFEQPCRDIFCILMLQIFTEVAWTRGEKKRRLYGEESEENVDSQEETRKNEKKMERLHKGRFGSSGSYRGRCC